MKEKIKASIENANAFLYKALVKLNRLDCEIFRKASVADTLLQYGNISISNNELIVARECIEKNQLKDGGWESLTDSCYSIKFLNRFNCRDSVQKGIKWVINVQKDNGSWGEYQRARGKLRDTYFVIDLLANLLPRESLVRGFEYMEKVWEEDLKFDVGSTYKASYYLISAFKLGIEPRLMKESIGYILRKMYKENPYGYFIPSHIALSTRALVLYQDKYNIQKSYIENSISRILDHQLKSGAWGETYLDFKTALIVDWLSEMLNFL
jgi:hypothetical protein